METQEHKKVIHNLMKSNAYTKLAVASSLDLTGDNISPVSTLFAFAPYKSGSTLLFNGLQLLSGPSFTGMTYKSYYDESFNLYGNTSSWLDIISPDDLFASSKYIYGGFRDADFFASINQDPIKIDIVSMAKALTGESKFIFLFRDPRDCLVSLYYSHLKSHRITTPSSSLTLVRAHAASIPIELYVLQNLDAIFQNIVRMLVLIDALKQAGIQYQIFSYEYSFYNQHEMFRDICSSINYDLTDMRWKHLVDASQASLNPLNMHPISEDDSRHIRKGVPGDYKDKLSESTIRLINEPLQPILKFLQRANPSYNYID
jgi:hypothetical protein